MEDWKKWGVGIAVLLATGLFVSGIEVGKQLEAERIANLPVERDTVIQFTPADPLPPVILTKTRVVHDTILVSHRVIFGDTIFTGVVDTAVAWGDKQVDVLVEISSSQPLPPDLSVGLRVDLPDTVKTVETITIREVVHVPVKQFPTEYLVGGIAIGIAVMATIQAVAR